MLPTCGPAGAGLGWQGCVPGLPFLQPSFGFLSLPHPLSFIHFPARSESSPIQSSTRPENTHISPPSHTAHTHARMCTHSKAPRPVCVGMGLSIWGRHEYRCVHTHTCIYRCSPPMAFPNSVHTQRGLRRHTHLSCPQVCTDIHTHCWAHFSPSQAPGPRVLVFTACSLGSTCSQVIPSPREHLPPGDAFWGGF